MTPKQLKLKKILVGKHVPEEWAHLIAERAVNAKDDGFFCSAVSDAPSDILCGAFSWRYAPEGFEFWQGVCQALDAEEEWREENGDLTVEQVKFIDHMVKVGMPQEWAILVAQASERPHKWRSPMRVSKKQPTPSGCLMNAFHWDESEEGYSFWESAYQAMFYESEHQRK